MYPIFVSDGQQRSFAKEFNISFPKYLEIHGIDISWHNGAINWEEINKNRGKNKFIHFVFIKATEGSDLVDTYYATNWDNAKKSGFIRGSYHFFNSVSDPKLQALNYIINTKHEKGDLYPVLDFENLKLNDAQRKRAVSNMKIWLEIVEKELGVKPIIYTNQPLYKKYIKNVLSDYPIWLSDFNAKDINNERDANLIIWQHSEKGKLNGIDGKVDFNLFLGDSNDFKKIVF